VNPAALQAPGAAHSSGSDGKLLAAAQARVDHLASGAAQVCRPLYANAEGQVCAHIFRYAARLLPGQPGIRRG